MRWLYVAGMLLTLLLARRCYQLLRQPAALPKQLTELPPNFPAPLYAPQQNPPASEAFALGRKLFYDARLSRDGSVSCASCHRQANAFASSERFSRGIGGQVGLRNAPALQNLRWKRAFFADGGPKNLETLPLAPLTNAREMGTTLPEVLGKLNADSDYVRRFAQVYCQPAITSYQLLRTLAQFTAALTSANSRYDHYVRHESGGYLTPPELRGYALFVAKCQRCHAPDLFTDESFRNTGLPTRQPVDSGRIAITFQATDRERFKVPSLRNCARTAPYLHDGRFSTLQQVLAHYDHGMVDSPTLDPLFRQPTGRLGIPLTAKEQRDLISFLGTLTDTAFCQTRAFAAPQLAKSP